MPIVEKKFLYFLWIFQRAGHLKKGGHKFLRILGTKAPLNLGHGLKLLKYQFLFWGIDYQNISLGYSPNFLIMRYFHNHSQKCHLMVAHFRNSEL